MSVDQERADHEPAARRTAGQQPTGQADAAHGPASTTAEGSAETGTSGQTPAGPEVAGNQPSFDRPTASGPIADWAGSPMASGRPAIGLPAGDRAGDGSAAPTDAGSTGEGSTGGETTVGETTPAETTVAATTPAAIAHDGTADDGAGGGTTTADNATADGPTDGETAEAGIAGEETGGESSTATGGADGGTAGTDAPATDGVATGVAATGGSTTGTAEEGAAEAGGPAKDGTATQDKATTAEGKHRTGGTDATGSDDAADKWTHFGPRSEHAGPFRRTMRALGRFLAHEWTIVCLAATALAVVMTWPSAWHPASTIPSDIWDPTLQAWQLAWAGHALLHDPSQLWNANAFYPDSYSFAFSDTLFGYFPFALIGTGPTAALVRYNILFILLEALAFIGAYALVRQLGARRTAAAVAGAAFAYAPWRWAQAGHMHVLSVGGIALSLAMLARGHGFSFTRGYRPERTRPGWAVAGWCVAAWQISLGFGIGLPFAYVLIAVVIVAAVRWLIKGRPALGRRLLLADGVGVVVFGAVGLFMGLPYLQVIKQHPEAKRSLAEVAEFSPSLRSFITAPQQSLPWGAAHAAARATMTAPAEMTLLPGFMLYGLAAAGLFFSIWSVRTRLWLLAGTLLSVALAEGTQFYGGGKYTYVLLYKYLPFFSSSRTPGRLIIWTTLLLGILAAGAIGALVGRSYDVAAERGPVATRPGLLLRLATLLPLVLVLAEGTNWHSLQHPVVPAQPAAMRTVQGPMLVLPSDALTDENVMFWSTTKFQKIVNGGSGFYPADQQNTRNIAKSFPDQPSVDYLRGLGIRAVVVLKAQALNSTDYAKAAAPDVPIDGLGITRQDMGDTIVYELQ
ncbi:hypothetical protein GCM10023322_41400 [Rugosimonospora acidiphila]|uniref:Dolichyl-phosphate-mannose-protein mannosyltransferase n=1 Tax=Rugosimonospora acidiphila TaxID=556531 RepID=A0ABP9S0V8_9ACTN